MASKPSNPKNASNSDAYNLLPSFRELVLVSKTDAGLQARGASVASTRGTRVSDIAKLLKSEAVSMAPLFGETEERLQQEAASMAASAPAEMADELPDLSRYYRVEAPEDKLESLCDKFLNCLGIDGAYVTPAPQPAQEVAERLDEAMDVNRMAPSLHEAPPLSPDFTGHAGYLNAAPVGIDARYAWTQSGGRGRNVRIIDIEGAWRFTHEDLRQGQGGVAGGTPTSNLGWENHGTAVIGEFSGDRNTYGITGICPDAHVRGVSIFGGVGPAAAIRQAANLSRPGDIVLIELHRAGPRFNFSAPQGQRGFIAMEYWPDVFDAIRYAVNRGVIIVEAAGNGAENLDDPIYDARPAGFPSTWRNPFRRGARDSGAILVGAGAPPPGTHGRNHGPDRSRLGFSNWGSALDAQGWGREVTTCGYGDLQGGSNRDLWYTDRFSGTSSASPIVVGAIACTQGVLRARGRIPLTPARARDLLRSSGSAQADAPTRPRSQRIGRRPNLRQLIPRAMQQREWLGVQFTGTLPANATRTWFTHSWPAHWHVNWSVMPTSPASGGGAQIKYEVSVQRSSDRHTTYFIKATNLRSSEVQIEARYAVLGW